jgi:pimeloyl-ACP methyl ester carboxylesterase
MKFVKETGLAFALVTSGVTAAMVNQVYSAHQTTRVYLMRGLGELSPFGRLEASLRAKGAVVSNWSWLSREWVVSDALQHPKDKIVIAGHSMGALEAFTASEELKARGLRVTTIGLDPLCTWPRATKGLVQYNIWGSWCWGQVHLVPGAHNINVPSTYGHIGYPADPKVIATFVQKAFQ